MERAKIFINDDLEIQENPKWHLIPDNQDTTRTACSGEAIDGSTRCDYIIEKLDYNKRNQITCPACLDFIKKVKKVKI